jgi:hypothetical protein
VLEDKTAGEDFYEDHKNEYGVYPERLYGICVIHSRMISETVPESSGKSVQFSADVCYAFITRFPLFDFFFQTIWDILSSERLARMETLSEFGESDPNCDRNTYEYVPCDLLTEILETLSRSPKRPPKVGEQFRLQVSEALPVRQWMRATGSAYLEEYQVNIANWALPIIFEWLPSEVILWALGLLFGEAKLLIVGSDPGIISSAVMGLMMLMGELKWVAPLIPVLPVKHIDFIESPVPIVAGIHIRQSEDAEKRGSRLSFPSSHSPIITTIEDSQKTDGGEDISQLIDIDPFDLLIRANDAAYGNMCGVLDLSRRDILVPATQLEKLTQYSIPGAVNLLEKLEAITGKSKFTSSPTNAQKAKWGVNSVYDKPHFEISSVQRERSLLAQECIREHMSIVSAKAKSILEKRVDSIEHAITNRKSVGIAEDLGTVSPSSSDPSEDSSADQIQQYYMSSSSQATPYKTYRDSLGGTITSLLSVPFEAMGANNNDFFGT